MTERLDEFPEVFKTPDVMPWELPVSPIVWEWGADRGKLLSDIDSRELIRKLRWLEAHGGFPKLAAAVEAVLTERQGE